MPRTLSRTLRACLRRANPIVETYVEVSAPDLSTVFRRTDQFATSTPVAAFGNAATGGISIPAGSNNLANFTDTSGSYDLNIEDPSRRVKGLSWQLDPAFASAKLRTFTARIWRDTSITALAIRPDFQLQIYRVKRTPGVLTTATSSTRQTNYEFAPLLSSPPIIKYDAVAWSGTGGAHNATLVFDLSNYGLTIENAPGQSYSATEAGELPKYYFVLTIVGNVKSTGRFQWKCDTVTSRTVANVGTFVRTFWARNNAADTWVENTSADVPSATIAVDAYNVSAQGVYAIDLGDVPSTNSTVRAVFERNVPLGTSATAEIATVGGTGPWTAIKNGDTIATKQQHYWLRATLAADTARRATPIVNALGIESRVPVDVSVESIVEYPGRSITAPYLTTEIAEAKLTLVRTGRRDFRDPATILGSSQSPPKLEADFYLGAKHPNVTRDDWLLMERMPVSNRTPSSLAEEFTLLSYASKLKRKIPSKVETITTVHAVTSATTTAIIVDPTTPLLSGPYDGKGYYMRVRSTTSAEIDAGFEYPIAGSTTISGAERQLDFNPALPDALSAGDIIEVHSGVFNTADASWTDADPAVVWNEILVNYLGLPPDRVGQGWLPRGGMPPRVTDRAPGDTATQNKLKVSMKLTQQEEAGKILDQLSFIMGGATVEIAGNICFVQIYPLRAPDGTITVPLNNVAGVFDARDITGLGTPPGLESRATVVSCDYGVNALAAAQDNTPAHTTQVVDSDALNWLTVQDLDQVGSGTIPSDITRWLYNSADQGFYLATQCAGQVNRAAATGLRVWSGAFSEAQPQLVQGDVIVVSTDAYTDHDPTTVRDIAGPLAVRGVILDLGARGTTFSIYVLGLTDNVVSLAGSKPGENAGLGVAPDAPQVGVGFDATGHAVISVFLGGRASSSRLVIGTTVPSDATLLASAIINGTSYASTFTTPIFGVGSTLYGKIIEYTGTDGTGTSSQVFAFTVPKGAGVSAAQASSIAGGAALIREAMTRNATAVGAQTAAGGFSAVPLFDSTGANVLLDPQTKRISTSLSGPTGIASSVFERGGYKGDQALNSSNRLTTGLEGAQNIIGGDVYVDPTQRIRIGSVGFPGTVGLFGLISAFDWQEEDSSSSFVRSGSSIKPGGTGLFTGSCGIARAGVPYGATIVGVDYAIRRPAGINAVAIFCQIVDPVNGNTNFAQLTDSSITPSASLQVYSFSVSQLMTNQSLYSPLVRASLVGNGEIAYVLFSYTLPDYLT